MTAERPYTLVAELTYRCPLRCIYCSNPVSRRGTAAQPSTSATGRFNPATELPASEWKRVIAEAADLGVMQLHLTGGEPLLRDDLEALVAEGRARGLYVNLITSGIPLPAERIEALRAAGLDAVQVSFQDVDAEAAAETAGVDRHEEKLRAAARVRAAGLPLTVNVVLHRGNLARTARFIALAEDLGAHRVELANTQYLGWALANRDLLMPPVEALEDARRVAEEARERLRGKMEVLFVLPDYHSDRPRACMDGWARRTLVVSADGMVLPCQAATDLPLSFDGVGDAPLARIWEESPALNAYRGEAWMSDACRPCDRRSFDFGGCRCQAFRLTGNAAATDPACSLSPDHALVVAARRAAAAPPPPARYRSAPAVP